MRKRTSGFTLIELLVVVAVIGILATILIPNLLDALHKAKQKRTVADMRTTGTAMMAWLTDQMSAAAAGARVNLDSFPEISHADLVQVLVPIYAKKVPQFDGWGYPYDYFLEASFGSRGQEISLAIRSRGRDGFEEGDSYTWGSFPPWDYDRDIVWWAGFFLRWPEAGSHYDGGCNQGVGNGYEDCDPGNSNQGNPDNSNDEGGGVPGNPGKKGGRR